MYIQTANSSLNYEIKPALLGVNVGSSVQISAWSSVYKPFTEAVQSNPKLPCTRAGSPRPSPCCVSSPLCSGTKTVLVFFLAGYGWSSHSSSKCGLAAVLFALSVQHQFCLLCFRCCWRKTLNKKARSNQGENATLPPWGLCHLCFADNGEKSNENKWVAPCCRSLCLEGIWPTNDNNTSWNGLYWNEITRKKARAEEKQADCVRLDWEQPGKKKRGGEKRFKRSI